ncbi:DedA family protein [Oleispirillum naphthae]|uniref:DedA family protein n=1 Tax=Oleispirillum naphthae TaxID=2838853 RepID=UPI0030822624
MTFAQALSDYGYAAVLVGTLLEGESILLLAGFAAHMGYLSLPLVLVCAFCGGTLGDQIAFFVGRRYGRLLLARWPSLARHRRRITRLIFRHQIPLILGIRFLYGMRIAGPILIGSSRVPPLRFAAFNMLGAAIWAAAIGGAGYLFGRTLEVFFADAKSYEQAAFLVLIGAVLLFAAGRWLYGRWHA